MSAEHPCAASVANQSSKHCGSGVLHPATSYGSPLPIPCPAIALMPRARRPVLHRKRREKLVADNHRARISSFNGLTHAVGVPAGSGRVTEVGVARIEVGIQQERGNLRSLHRHPFPLAGFETGHPFTGLQGGSLIDEEIGRHHRLLLGARQHAASRRRNDTRFAGHRDGDSGRSGLVRNGRGRRGGERWSICGRQNGRCGLGRDRDFRCCRTARCRNRWPGGTRCGSKFGGR